MIAGDGMKKIVGALGGLAVLGLLSYPGFGYLVEKGVRQQLAAMPKQYGMSVELTDFHRHWFTSDAKILWKWQIPAHLTQNSQGQTITISPQNYEKEFEIKIFHGPLVMTSDTFFIGIGHADTHIQWPLFSNLPVKENFTKDSVFPSINIQMALNFLNQATWNTQIPAFKLKAVNHSNQIDWHGLEIHNKIKNNAQSFKGEIDFPGAHINQQNTLLDINNLHSDYHFKHDDSGLYIGKLGFDVDTLSIKDTQNHDFQVHEWKVASHSEVDQGLFSTELDVHFKDVIVNGEKFGPLALALELSKMNASALNQMHEILKPQQNASPSFRQKNIWALLTTVPELLKHGMDIRLKQLDLNLEQGKINTHAEFVLAPDEAGGVMALQSLKNLQGHIEIQVTQTLLSHWLKDLLEKQISIQQASLSSSVSADEVHDAASSRADQKLKELVSLGVIKTNTSDYIFHINLSNGQLLVNNLPFNPAWLVM